MKTGLVMIIFMLLSVTVQAERQVRPEVEVNLPAEAFSHGGQKGQPCARCCVYKDRNYSEGAVIKVEGVLLQCMRDENTTGTNPLIWRHMQP